MVNREERVSAAMSKTCCLLFFAILLCSSVQAQKKPGNKIFTDSTAYYDDLFSDLDGYLDSILAPRTFFLVNVGLSRNYYDYLSSVDYTLETKRKLVYTPSVGYYHKSGFGIGVSSNIITDGGQVNPYQYLLTGSYDYIKNDNFMTGLSLTHYFTKKQLPFYTTPLLNEADAYFTYRRSWIKPSLMLNYGWGSRSAYNEREEYITSLRLRPDGYTRVNTNETVADFTVAASIRHDFYWFSVLTKHSVLRLTPQLMVTAGTQKFGFNQNSNTYGLTIANNVSELYSTSNLQLDDQLNFQPLSFMGQLKAELSFGKYFIQPQAIFNYYFPAHGKNFSTALRLNAGLVF